MLLIKFGGSVISDKSSYLSFRADVVKKIVDTLPKSGFMVVHGAGSFGHILAHKYDIVGGYADWKKLGFARIQRDMEELNLRLLSMMIDADIPAVSMPPHSFLTLGKEMNFDIFDRLLNYGFVPLTYGDAVFHTEKGVDICSGDLLMLELARRYKPEKTIFLTNVDGIYTHPPGHPDARLIHEFPRDKEAHTELQTRDVTGGMGYKIEVMREIAKHSKVYVINGFHPERLKNVLNDEDFVGTVIV
ncbi:MAG: isopentenyl phosphate kinase family protein [Euryarchaeota archaeon]|uniref:Isopentenyl phosphate kinase n=1 Tax=uncultured euryarchaeote Alv-FOS4 TaxID=337893 RepID=Q3SA96_9EURY|nr:predicted archaeal kinase [uncultured euryarchaeote Alv-FOS4]NPA75031.1 isopentenyl phosphate kinase family protein [Euryarchaeota archaeon]